MRIKNNLNKTGHDDKKTISLEAVLINSLK